MLLVYEGFVLRDLSDRFSDRMRSRTQGAAALQSRLNRLQTDALIAPTPHTAFQRIIPSRWEPCAVPAVRRRGLGERFSMFFHSFYDLARIAIVGVLAYITLIVMLRFTGKRTLSKMNAFDLIVTVALGSTLSAAILNNQVSLVECVLALALLCAVQYVVTFTSVRSQTFATLVKSEPALLFFEGRFLTDALRRERVTETETLAAMRSQGVADLDRVKAIVLEADGSLSVVQDKGGGLDTLRNVRGFSASE